MEISEKQKKKLRELLEKISTPEEMKAFDMEVLNKKTDNSTELILKKIDQNKPEKVDLSPISSVISKLSDKLNSLYEEFTQKKYPIYDDSDLISKIEELGASLKENPAVEEAERRRQKQMVDELIGIGDTLSETKDMLENSKSNSYSEQWSKLDESLDGMGMFLKQILAKTGSNDSFRLKDSSGDIINPANEETLKKIAGEYNLLYEIVGNYVYVGQSEGTDGDEAIWRIKRLDTINGKLYFADNIKTFTKVWTDRADYDY